MLSEALSQTGAVDKALKPISKDYHADADMLRVEILWRAKRWGETARALARLAGGVDTKKIEAEDALLLTKRAVASALNHDIEGLRFLRERYGPAMAKSKYAVEFKAVLGRKPVENEDYAEYAKQVGELDVFLSFLEKRRRGFNPKSAPTVN